MRNYTIIALCIYLLAALIIFFAASSADPVCIAAQVLDSDGTLTTVPVECFYLE